MKSIKILGVRVDAVTMAQALKLIDRWLQTTDRHQICTVNPEFVMRARADTAFAQVLAAADLNIPDGVGLIYAARLHGERLPERVAGSELVYYLAELCAQRNRRLFLLGAAPGVAEQAAEKLRALYPALVIAGCYAGSPDPADEEDLIARVNAARADVLYVAYGAPQQDKWIARNLPQLETVRIAIGVGGSLDFIAGRVPRAPRWMRRSGLEWFYRLLREPWRWRRMRALPRFAALVARDRLRQIRIR